MPPLTTSSARQWAWAAADRRSQARWWWRTRPEPPKPALLFLLPRASRRGHGQVAATRVPLARAARARQEVVDVVSEGGGGALSRAYLQGAAKAVKAAMGAAAADTVGPEASDTMRLSYADRRLVVCRVLPGNAAPGDGASSEAASSKVATAPAGAVGVAADTLTPPPSSPETAKGEWLGDMVAARARPQHISRSPRFILA